MFFKLVINLDSSKEFNIQAENIAWVVFMAVDRQTTYFMQIPANIEIK